jgi:hypothetical protein
MAGRTDTLRYRTSSINITTFGCACVTWLYMRHLAVHASLGCACVTWLCMRHLAGLDNATVAPDSKDTKRKRGTCEPLLLSAVRTPVSHPDAIITVACETSVLHSFTHQFLVMLSKFLVWRLQGTRKLATDLSEVHQYHPRNRKGFEYAQRLSCLGTETLYRTLH